MKRVVSMILCAVLLVGLAALPHTEQNVHKLVEDRDIFGTWFLNTPAYQMDFSEFSGRKKPAGGASDNSLTQRSASDDCVVIESEEEREALIEWIREVCPDPNKPESFEYLIAQIRSRLSGWNLKRARVVVLLTNKYVTNSTYVQVEMTNDGLQFIVYDVGESDSADWGPFKTLVFVPLLRSKVKDITSVDIIHRLVLTDDYIKNWQKSEHFPWFCSQDVLFDGQTMSEEMCYTKSYFWWAVPPEKGTKGN